MERYELQKLRDLPIEGVAERLGLRVSRHKALCPFHNDHTPSMSFKVNKNTFRCFVCGASGGTIDLVMKYLNKDFVEACRWLADEHGVILEERGKWKEERDMSGGTAKAFDASRYERFFERPWLNDEARRFLYEERRIDPRVVRWCRLTSWKDRQGGVQNRNLVKGATPRFRFPSGSQCGIYNLPVLNLLKPGDSLWITEGCSDCWAMLSAGHKAIAIPSATLLTHRDAQQLSVLSSQFSIEYHMFPDRDEPGERLFLQLQKVLPSLVHHQLPPGCKDFGEYYLKSEGRIPDKSS